MYLGNFAPLSSVLMRCCWISSRIEPERSSFSCRMGGRCVSCHFSFLSRFFCQISAISEYGNLRKFSSSWSSVSGFKANASCSCRCRTHITWNCHTHTLWCVPGCLLFTLSQHRSLIWAWCSSYIIAQLAVSWVKEFATLLLYYKDNYISRLQQLLATFQTTH